LQTKTIGFYDKNGPFSPTKRPTSKAKQPVFTTYIIHTLYPYQAFMYILYMQHVCIMYLLCTYYV